MQRKRLQTIRETLAFLLFSAILIALFSLLSSRVRYNWQWYRVPSYILDQTRDGFRPGPILEGLFLSLKISASSLFFALALGLVSAYMRLSEGRLAPFIARAYIEVVRNTPLIIQLFFIYFVISPIFSIEAQPSAILALSLFEGAYASEIIRGGVMAIDKGQWEAAYCLGFSKQHLYRDIIFPQSFRSVLPSLASQAVNTVKDSALVSTIAIYDLTMRAREIISETFLSFEIWFTVAAIYLIITMGLSLCIHLIDRLLQSKG